MHFPDTSSQISSTPLFHLCMLLVNTNMFIILYRTFLDILERNLHILLIFTRYHPKWSTFYTDITKDSFIYFLSNVDGIYVVSNCSATSLCLECPSMSFTSS